MGNRYQCTYPSLGLELVEIARRVSVTGGSSVPEPTSDGSVRGGSGTERQQIGGQ